MASRTLLGFGALSKPASRTSVLVIAGASVVFHGTLAHKLALVSRLLRTANEDEGVDTNWKRLEGLKVLVGVARLAAWSSTVIAVLGVVGALRVGPRSCLKAHCHVC